MGSDLFFGSTFPDDGPEHLRVPADFPRPLAPGSVSGSQAKVLLTEKGNSYFVSGVDAHSLFGRWEICEDLARQLAIKAQESKAGKRAAMAEVDILAQYLPRLIAMNWTSQEEARWVIARTAELLGWPSPLVPEPVPGRDASSD
jgi:hypothetical protein